MLEKLLNALDNVTWYNCYYEALEKIKTEISNKKLDEVTYYYDYGDDWGFQIIWMILVLMFGDYGTSPRTGYLTLKNKDEIIDFIDKITITGNEDY